MSDIIYTPYNREEILTAFQRALGDLTDAQIFALIQNEQNARAAADTQLSDALAAVNADLTAHYALTTALSAETAARTAADTKLSDGLTAVTDGGAKNLLSTGSVSTAVSAQYIDADLLSPIPAGQYIYSAEVTTNISTSGTSRITFLDQNGANIGYVNIERDSGQRKSAAITLTGTAVKARFNGGANNSQSGIFTVADPMLCTPAAWEISQAFVPYCPTMQALYQMVLALQQTRSADAAAWQDETADANRSAAAAAQPETEAENA